MSAARQDGTPYVRRGWWYTTLHFTEGVTQSRMYTWWPERLQIGYTRTMLAALLVQPAPRRIGILGLGGGSQAKFCHRHLPTARIDACESNADVLALRDAFRVPPNGDRFHAVHASASDFIRQRRNSFDLMLLDAYDRYGIPHALSTQDFYDDCRDALGVDGVLAINLYSTEARRHIARLRKSFEDRVQVLEEPDASNRVAFAWREDAQAHRMSDVLARLSWSARRQVRGPLRRLARALQDGSLEHRP